MILGGFMVTNNVSVVPFPVIDTVPLGAPGNPNVYADAQTPVISVEWRRAAADRERMELALAAFALAPGLALGSFLNVVAARLPQRRSVAHGRSACLHCGEQIAWHDNVPLVSYLLLHGRCRACGARIGWIYPAVEAASALLVAGCVLRFGLSWDALVAAFTCLCLVAISAADIRYRVVPNRIVLPAAVVVLAANTLLHPGVEWVAGGFGGALFLLLAAIAYPKGMGMGDVKLLLLIGFAVGRGAPAALMLGMLTAIVPSAILFARHGSAARKMAIPFAPFLALGGVVALFWGHAILHWYLGFTS
jgi:leader peptidase (prepilin peptidase)/N-methyltransferase